jgi:5-methylcytosine-specific restriction protein B
MSLSDDIRKFAYEEYIEPARKKGLSEVTIRSGDLHNKMGLKNRMPAVCGALGTDSFKTQYSVKLIRRSPVTNGANVYFTFQI